MGPGLTPRREKETKGHGPLQRRGVPSKRAPPPAPSKASPASRPQTLTSPASPLVCCTWPLWQESRVATLATAQGLPAGKVQAPQWPSGQPPAVSLPYLPGPKSPTSLGSGPRLKGGLLRWQVPWKEGIRHTRQPVEQVRGDRRQCLCRGLLRMSREGGRQEGLGARVGHEWSGRREREETHPRTGIHTSQGPSRPHRRQEHVGEGGRPGCCEPPARGRAVTKLELDPASVKFPGKGVLAGLG